MSQLFERIKRNDYDVGCDVEESHSDKTTAGLLPSVLIAIVLGESEEMKWSDENGEFIEDLYVVQFGCRKRLDSD